ncbi:MAG: TRAM domain-containing protein [Candidatus Omnitrophota bacterium]
MTLIFVRVFFLIISGTVGYQIGLISDQPLIGVGFGCLAGLGLIFLEANMRRVSVSGLSSMVFGLILGMIMAKLITDILSLLPLGDVVHSILKVVLTLTFSYLGAVMALRGKDEFNLIIPYVRFKRQDLRQDVVLLDTSSIIDGRIADVCKTKFFEARIVVPRFILQELQHIADSEDSNKRQRGRRGMEILRSMQKDSSLDVKIHEDEGLTNEETDAKLIRLAKLMEARICTTDFNLNRIATIQGVTIMNVNELANAVKSIVFPGEIMDVRLLKEGKEPNQAVAYLDDGTMIVVSDARRYIGQKMKVIVTSVLQTQAGKMIFAKPQNNK